MPEQDLDLIGHYTGGPSSLPRQLQSIRDRLDDLFLPGYRRDGSDAAEVFPPEFQAQSLLEGFTGPDQMIVTDGVGSIATLDVPPFGWIGRPSSGGIAAGALSLHSMIFRTGDAAGGVADSIYTGTIPPGGQMMRTRGGAGFFAQDVVAPLPPGDIAAETMAAQVIPLNSGTTVLDYDGPYLYSTNSVGGIHKFVTPPQGGFRPGAQWWFATPSGQMSGSASSPSLWVTPGSGQRINSGTGTLYQLGGRVLSLLMAVGTHSGAEHFVFVSWVGFPGSLPESGFNKITSSQTISFVPGTYFVDATAGDITVTMLPAADHLDSVYHLKRVDSTANTVTVVGDGAELIDNEDSADLQPLDSARLVSDATQWRIT